MKERKKLKEDDQPLLGLEERKEMVQKQLMKEERKIKTRHSKKSGLRALIGVI